jgi:uncharacterized protein
MQWTRGRQSTNVEDRRGMGGGRIGGPAMIGGGGIGVLVLALVAMFFGVDPSVILSGGGGGGGYVDQATYEPGQQQRPAGPEEAQREQFVRYVLGDTEETWERIFRQSGADYPEPQLVLFSGSVDSACGAAGASTGPFYCPADRKVYLDMSFFDELTRRFGAPGDAAQAYVIAHEVGHHVQTVLGLSERVQRMRQGASREESNQLSVLMELQADCFAGVWANHANRDRQVLEPGDVDEGLRAAAAVGDDQIQARTRGYVVPESFTHGSAEQRVSWFRRGLDTGDVQACDTFGAAGL